MGIGKALKAVGKALRAVWRTVFGREAAAKLRDAAVAVLKSAAGQIVLAVVAELSASNLSNDLRRQAAFRRIREQFTASGIEVKDSMINLLIELAVQRLKGLVDRPQIPQIAQK